MPDDFSFGKTHRIRSGRDFARIKDRGKRRASEHFILLSMKNALEEKRLGIIATRKVGKANVRNRWKRYIKEFFRLNKKIFPESTDFVFIIKRGSQKPYDFAVISEELKALVGGTK